MKVLSIDIETVAHLLKHDSSYGTYAKEVKVNKDQSELIVDGKVIKYFSETDPAKLPWGGLEVDVVLECTGAFLTIV